MREEQLVIRRISFLVVGELMARARRRTRNCLILRVGILLHWRPRMGTGRFAWFLMGRNWIRRLVLGRRMFILSFSEFRMGGSKDGVTHLGEMLGKFGHSLLDVFLWEQVDADELRFLYGGFMIRNVEVIVSIPF